MIRREIYEKVLEAVGGLRDIEGGALFRHVDLWNRNVEFVDQEDSWERPALFLEFGAIEWQHDRPAPGERCSMRCVAELSLHVVTDWHAGCHPDAFGLLGTLRRALTGLCGDHFARMMPDRELSNHDHGELLEEILVMRYHGYDAY